MILHSTRKNLPCIFANVSCSFNDWSNCCTAFVGTAQLTMDIYWRSNSRLQHAPKPNAVFGFYALGKPLACICQGAAIYSLLIGTFRTWRSQNAIVRGKAITGGYEIILMAFGIFAVGVPVPGLGPLTNMQVRSYLCSSCSWLAWISQKSIYFVDNTLMALQFNTKQWTHSLILFCQIIGQPLIGANLGDSPGLNLMMGFHQWGRLPMSHRSCSYGNTQAISRGQNLAWHFIWKAFRVPVY